MAEVDSIPRVSVVSIFYNADTYIEEAIESVLSQTYRDFELLLVDDGSTDASSTIALEFVARDPRRIRYLRHRGGANRGMSASRNLGLGAACGEFIAFIDADDRWARAKLEEQLAIFDRLPEIDAVFGAVNYWRSWAGGHDRLVPTGHVQNQPIFPPDAILSLYPLGKAAAPCPSDMMVRRSMALALGGFEESFTGPLQMYEDQAFLSKLYLAGTIYFADSKWLDYRIHGDSCVAAVSRGGGYHSVRRHFLEWLATYLERSDYRQSPAIRRALDRAMRPYRYPRLARRVRGLKSVARRLRTG